MTADHLAVYATREAAQAHLAAEHANAVREAYGVPVSRLADPVGAHAFLEGQLPRTRKEPA
jgi:hypothetical protein